MNAAISIRQTNDYLSQLTDRLGFTLRQNRYETRYIVPGDLGSGYISYMSLGGDVEFSIVNLRLHQPIRFFYEDYDNSLEISYCTQGHIGHEESAVGEVPVGAGEFGVYLKKASRGHMEYPCGKHVHIISIGANEQLLSRLPMKEKYLDAPDPSTCSHIDFLSKPRKTGFSLQALFAQFESKNLDESIRPLYLEGLAKMIVSTVWQKEIMGPLAGSGSCRLCALDQRQICEATHILEKNLTDPPTITQLARMVTLNEHKLKTGFRELFGQTIYEYLRTLRMEKARALLIRNELTIGQIAYEVGYINASHFSDAFRKKYGVTPRDFHIGL